MTEKGHLIRF